MRKHGEHSISKKLFQRESRLRNPCHKERKMTDLYACITLHGEEGATEEQKVLNTSKEHPKATRPWTAAEAPQGQLTHATVTENNKAFT